MGDEQRPPDRFLIPVSTLGVPRAWPLGNVVFHPSAERDRLLAGAPPVQGGDGVIGERLLDILGTAPNGTIAEVRGAPDIDGAVDSVRSALDALRLFQLARRVTQTTTFGLPGDIYHSVIEYGAVWDGQQTAPGGRFRGDGAGWTFDDTAMQDWSTSSAFQFLSDALSDPHASEGGRRAVIGTELFGRAAAEHRRDLKMLGIVSALEMWLLPWREPGLPEKRQHGPQAMRLARHAAWFGCGLPHNDLCGRARPVCPYLRLSPDDRKDRNRLDTLRILGNDSGHWRCSEWHRVMDWYDARSGAAHGNPSEVDSKTASEAEYWVAHYLAEPILDWLGTHRENPVGDLMEAIDLIEEPARWQDMLDALDDPSPPAVPPL